MSNKLKVSSVSLNRLREMALFDAWAEGSRSGAGEETRAGLCPYLHDRLALRDAWMDGFAAGRQMRMNAKGR